MESGQARIDEVPGVVHPGVPESDDHPFRATLYRMAKKTLSTTPVMSMFRAMLRSRSRTRTQANSPPTQPRRMGRSQKAPDTRRVAGAGDHEVLGSDGLGDHIGLAAGAGLASDDWSGGATRV